MSKNLQNSPGCKHEVVVASGTVAFDCCRVVAGTGRSLANTIIDLLRTSDQIYRVCRHLLDSSELRPDVSETPRPIIWNEHQCQREMCGVTTILPTRVSPVVLFD